MSDTPETDSLREAIDNGAAVEAEITSLAGKLERERDEARATVEALRDQLCADKCRDKAAADGGWGNF